MYLPRILGYQWLKVILGIALGLGWVLSPNALASYSESLEILQKGIKADEDEKRNLEKDLKRTRDDKRVLESGDPGDDYRGNCHRACTAEDGTGACTADIIAAIAGEAGVAPDDIPDHSENNPAAANQICRFLYVKIKSIRAIENHSVECANAVKACGYVKLDLKKKEVDLRIKELEGQIKDKKEEIADKRKELSSTMNCTDCMRLDAMKPRTPTGWDYALGFTQALAPVALGGLSMGLTYDMYGKSLDAYSGGYNAYLGQCQLAGVPCMGPMPMGFPAIGMGMGLGMGMGMGGYGGMMMPGMGMGMGGTLIIGGGMGMYPGMGMIMGGGMMMPGMGMIVGGGMGMYPGMGMIMGGGMGMYPGMGMIMGGGMGMYPGMGMIMGGGMGMYPGMGMIMGGGMGMYPGMGMIMGGGMGMYPGMGMIAGGGMGMYPGMGGMYGGLIIGGGVGMGMPPFMPGMGGMYGGMGGMYPGMGGGMIVGFNAGMPGMYGGMITGMMPGMMPGMGMYGPGMGMMPGMMPGMTPGMGMYGPGGGMGMGGWASPYLGTFGQMNPMTMGWGSPMQPFGSGFSSALFPGGPMGMTNPYMMGGMNPMGGGSPYGGYYSPYGGMGQNGAWYQSMMSASMQNQMMQPLYQQSYMNNLGGAQQDMVRAQQRMMLLQMAGGSGMGGYYSPYGGGMGLGSGNF